MLRSPRPALSFTAIMLAWLLLWQSAGLPCVALALGYDELNRATAVQDQLKRIKTMHYDTLGRMDWIQMPVEANRQLRTRFGYNELGQKLWQQDALGVEQDALGGLDVNVAAPVNRVTKFAYDERGRMIQRVMPGQFNGVTLAENMEYNNLGQLKRSQDFRGFVTSYDYDLRGRLKVKTPDARLNEMPIEMAYSADELTTTTRRGNAVTTTHQDADRGWMESVELPNGASISYGHDDWGRTLGKTIRTGSGANLSTRTTSFGYDELDRLLTITANDQKTWSYGYDEVGNKASLTRPNGTATVYDYDDLNRLKGMATRKGTLAQAVAGTSPLVSSFAYHVRADGRRDQLTEAIAHPDGSSVTRTVNYGFDLANRLTSESGSNGEGKSYSKSYELDAAGNRKSLTEMREGQLYAQTSYGYNSLDWLTGTTTQTKDATSNVAYDYDANGAQISQTTTAGTTGQKWDFEGHLLASGQVNAQGQWSGAKTSYTYDASGMRLSQASWNAAGVVTDGTSYVWDGDRVAEERDEKGALQAVYEHGQELGPLRLTRRAGTVAAPVEQERYFIGDGQDSTRQLLDENGLVKDSYFYDSFGVGLAGGQGATENSFKYTGQQQDASGLYYLRARYYNAGTGRFLSQDPEMGSAMDPDSMHRYLYSSVNPVNKVDPSGRSDFTMFGITCNIQMGALVGGVGNGVVGMANGHSGGQLVDDVNTGMAFGMVGATHPLVAAGIGVVFTLQAIQSAIQLQNSPSASPIDKAKAWANVALMLGGTVATFGSLGKTLKATSGRANALDSASRACNETSISYASRGADGLFENGAPESTQLEEITLADNTRGLNRLVMRAGAVISGNFEGYIGRTGKTLKWVILADDSLAIVPALDEQFGGANEIKHTAAAGGIGVGVKAAGEVAIQANENGPGYKVAAISNRTGHYACPPEVMEQGLNAFESNGFDVTGAERITDGWDSQQELDGYLE